MGSRPRAVPHPPAPPRWRTAFPVNWEEDRHITRREFTSFLTLASGLLFFATGVVGAREWWRGRRPPPAPAVRLARVTEVPVGGAQLFHYPTADDPCLLIRLADDRFVAYGQKCTHLSCPVVYRAAAQEMHCPCHRGRFAVADGRAVAGPPRRSLPRITLTRSGEDIWATGVKV